MVVFRSKLREGRSKNMQILIKSQIDNMQNMQFYVREYIFLSRQLIIRSIPSTVHK